ncbi:MAG TPA: HNH endonuclease signature motif containing protein [Streptosporangiaceae bacterium]
MTRPPDPPPPAPPDPPARPAPAGPPPDGPPAVPVPAGLAACAGDGWDGEAVLAGLDPDTAGLDPAVLAGRHVPSDAELCGEYPPDGDDGDDEDDGFLVALAAGRGAAFTAGGPVEAILPGGTLAGLSQYAFGDGLAGLSDDGLVGLLHAARRLSAWQSGIELAAVAELDHRRVRDSGRPGWSRVSEHVAAELAAALVLTGRSADALLTLARDLARLPAVLRALLAGQIDRARAMVFAAELAALAGPAASAAAAALLPGAAGMTTGQLRAALRTLVLSIDPAAVRRRMTKARDDARVEAWQEGSGNLALAGRELAPADAAAADRRITAIAEALKDNGAAGTLDQLRAAVFTALLAGHHPDTLLPAPPGPGHAAASSPGPAAGSNPGPDRPRPSGRGADAAGNPGPAASGPTGPAGSAGPGSPGAVPGPAGGGLAALTGSVHLTLPAATWLALADLPGEAAGLGPLDAWTSRDLAARLAAGTGTRWHLTLLRPDGTAAAHASARTGPGPPRSGPDGWRDWLAGLRFTWITRAPCPHGSQVPAYRPPAPVRQAIRARNRTCAFPGCRRPAAASDLDHTIPYDQGGRTCPCNLAPLCRRHHKTKQAPGWKLDQPQPGVLVWTAPHGRRYTVTPSTYLS